MKLYQPAWTTRLAQWIAWRLPREIVYWCAIRLHTHAYTTVHPDAEMGTLDMTTVFDAWHKEAAE